MKALVVALLRGGAFIGANLSGAYLSGTNLSGANLSKADLSGAGLYRANLAGANLTGANLTRTYLAGANLTDTVLDPSRPTGTTAEQLTAAGLTVEGEYAYGWRTRVSQHAGSTVYRPGEYTAPFFSVCRDTECHPGIYLASQEWLDENAYSSYRVRVRALVSDCLVAGDKIRARTIEVID